MLDGLDGKVLQVSRDGLGFVEELQTNRRYPFTFDKIVGYKGETLKELEAMGIRAGARVRFVPTFDKIVVTKIYPVADVQTKCPNCQKPITVVPVPKDTLEIVCQHCGYHEKHAYWVGDTIYRDV